MDEHGLLTRWLRFARIDLQDQGWYPYEPPALVTQSGDTLRALVAETEALLAQEDHDAHG